MTSPPTAAANLEFDHLVLATHDLEAAKQRFHESTGVVPADGGSHPGRGTRNALVSFGPGRYLEILGPDPEQAGADKVAAWLAEPGADRLLHWAIRSSHLPAVAESANAAGFKAGPIFPMSRARPDGRVLEWDLMPLAGHDLGGLVPFFIDWRDSPHPSESVPEVGPLVSLVLRLPEGNPLRGLLEPAPSCAELREGGPELLLQFGSPRGTIRLAGEKLAGFPF